MLVLKTTAWDSGRFTEIGRGGEAVVYKMRDDLAGKIFLSPGAPEFAGNAQLQEAARVRIAEMQYKLSEFPADLPPGLIAPTGVLMDEWGKIFGYVMPFVDGTPLERLTRTTSGLKQSFISRCIAKLCSWVGKPRLSPTAKLLLGLHDLVSGVHAKGVIIGDFNEHNVIVGKDMTPYLVDADSMQFGRYQCRSFMPRFVAPELLDFTPAASRQQFGMAAPHSELTDWYSFLVIAMRLITCTEPYGGVMDGVDLRSRLEQRVTVFDQRVIYPVVARPLREVPRPILEMFFRMFYKGERFIPARDAFRSA